LYVLIVDFIVVVSSFVLSYFFVKHFEFPSILRGHLAIYTIAYSACALFVFFMMRIHSGVIRYTTVMDMCRIFAAIVLSGILYAFVDEFVIYVSFHIDSLSVWRILLVNFFVSSSALIMLRIAVRGLYYYLKINNRTSAERVIILGADHKALVIKQALESSEDSRFNVIGFLAERETSLGLNIQQKRVFSHKHLPILKKKYKADILVLTSNNLVGGFKQEVVNKCLELGIKILTVPPSEQWVYGKLKLKQIQDLKIEDLLQREPIQISDVSIFNQLSGKRILITGAAGSIGSEIVRQVLRYRPAMIILCDQAESPLHDILLEVEDKNLDVEIRSCLVNVRDFDMIKIPFEEYRPEIVFHAAAYKHVPMMEKHPVEAILTNVLGTKHVANLSVMYEVDRFVMISTDKAVNPTNVMGASKRIAEIYIQSLRDSAKYCKTKFMTTRFGNVLDSNGSVIPRFRSQIQNGGPVTVTHPEIVRYFMTIPEAVQLVLEAAAAGNGGEIFVFDMGKPVKIYELATNMIKLAGLTVDKDIKVVFTGLRPGEKLYEELLNDEELVKPTHHEKIKIANVIQHDHEKVQHDVFDLIRYSKLRDEENIVRKMKAIVPEFKSQNSIYAELDFVSVESRVS
jgi:FlaA1/EpsC-like NDP-sugar epimerase